MKNTFIYIFIFICFAYFFLIFELSFHGPDEPVYFAYTESLIADKDLNIVNQIDYKQHPYYLPSGKFGISKTYNLPDFHNHGGVVLWAPFYGYAKAVSSITTVRDAAMSFSTLTFGFFTIIFTYFLCRIFFAPSVSLWSTLVLFLGTPFFYFMLHETGNANIIACLFSVISVWFLSFAISMKKSHLFLFGLLFSFSTVVKTEIWFQLIFAGLLFYILLIKHQVDWGKTVYFILGLVPPLILRSINDYLRYGALHLGELGLFDFKRNFYFFEQLFSSYRGFFYTSPIFYLCLAGLLMIIVSLVRGRKEKNKKMQDLFMLILSFYAVIKVFVLSYRYAWGGGTPGARILLTEIPVFVLLYAKLFSNTRNYLKYPLAILSLGFVFWNFLVISEYMAHLDLAYATGGAPPLISRIASLKYIFSVFSVKGLDMKLNFLLPAACVVLALLLYMSSKLSTPLNPSIWFRREQYHSRLINPFVHFTVYLIFAYIFVTGLNLYNNKRNVDKLKAGGFFRRMSLIGPKEFERLENDGSLDEMIQYYELKGDSKKAAGFKKIKEGFYNEK